MKALFLTSLKSICLFPLLAASPSFADITLVNDTFVGEAKTPARTTMYIKGDMVRTDNDTSSTMIMNTATGEMTTLMHEQKMVISTNLKQIAPPPAPSGEKAAPLPVTKITATGTKEKIDGYDCELYLSENNGMVVKMWVTMNYPNQDKLKHELKVLAKMAAGAGPEQPQVPGIGIKTEWEQQGMKFVTKLVGITTDSVDDGKFAIPAGYKAP